MAYTGKVAQYCSSTKYDANTQWATGVAKNVGDIVRQLATPSANNERCFVCIVAGTTHASTEPSWNVGRGDKTTDNTVTWQEFTGDPAGNGDIASVPNWTNGAKSTNVSQGHIIKDVAGTHIFIASTANNNAGTGAEPSWNVGSPGQTTTDGSVTWTYLGTSFSAWKAPHAKTQNMLASNWGTNNGAATDPTKFYVASDHAETQAASVNWSSRGSLTAPIDILCVAVAGSLPPVSADLTNTATVTTTGGNSITINSAIRVMYGLNFVCGTSSSVSISIGEGLIDKNFENCTFAFGSGAGSGASFQFNTARLIYRNCTFKFSNVGQTFSNVRGQVRFINCSVDSGGSVPTTFINETTSAADWSFEGCDLSTLSGSVIGANNSGGQANAFGFYDCKFPASFTPWTYSGSGSATGEKVTFSRCSSGALPLQFVYTERAGTLTASLAIYRTGGASENGVAFGWGIVTTANSSLGNIYFDVPPIAQNNTDTGVNVTVTVYGIVNAAALPNNDEIAMDVQYLGSASTPQATIKNNRPADFLASGSAHTADSTSAWDAGATARANTHAYSLGDIIKLASNPGRIFFATTAGTSAGSEPGGYASAVDGGSVTDGGAVFRAGVRFSMAVVCTSPQPQLAGMLYAKLQAYKKSTTYYIDPFIVLS